MHDSRPARAEWLWLPIVVVALLAIYLPGLGNALVYDDTYLVEGLFSDYATLQARVRMLSYGTFVWLRDLVGEGWWKQRLFNLFLHVAVVIALWALYREILRHVVPPADGADPSEAGEQVPYYRSPALGVSIGFFALNPVAVYGVAYLIQRSILLATLFTVLALWLFALALRARRHLLHLAALGCYALAVLSKEHAVFAPLAAVPLYILVERPSGRRLAALAAAGVALVGAVAGALYAYYGEIIGRPFDEYSHLYLAQLSALGPGVRENAFALSILNEAWLFFRYGLDWLLPWSGWLAISLRPPFPVSLFSFPHVTGAIGYVAVVAGGFVLLLRYRDGRALLGLALLFASLLYLTEFSTVWVQDPFSLYRSYLWGIGIPGLVFFALHGPSPKVSLGIGLVLAALLSWQAFDRVRSLSTPESAWTDAIRKLNDDPRSVGRWLPYLNRGALYVDQNLFNLALRDFEASAALGDQGMGMFNMGSILSSQKKHREALAAFERASKQGYVLPNLAFHLGMELIAVGRAEEGFGQLQAAVDAGVTSPTREIALLHIGRAGMQLGKRNEAVRALEQLVTAEPGHKEGRYLLGMAYVMKGEAQRAREVLDPLVRDDPNARVFYARALANYALKRKGEALADIDNALRLGMDNPHVREWQAKIKALP